MRAVLVLACLIALHSCAKTVREVVPLKYANCDNMDGLPIKVYIHPLGGIDKVAVEGYIEVTEDVTGDFDLTIESNKCDNFEMKNCYKYNAFKISNVCGFLTSKNSIFSEVLQTIKPSFKCPLKAGNYTLVDTVFDLKVFAMLPIDGVTWVANFRFGKNRKTLMCWDTETKIVKTRVKPSRNN